jgi:hypothetical protein
VAYLAYTMADLKLRKGLSSDDEWLFDLFRASMRDYIDVAWGWDELFQREGFKTNLPGSGFKILSLEGERIGGYHMQKKADHFWLGALMMQDIMSQAIAVDIPVRLSVLINNPAKDFYLKYGFTIYAKDDHSIKMVWSVPSQ